LQPTVFAEPELTNKDIQENIHVVSSDAEQVQAMLHPYFLRRLKDDIENATPATQETVIEVELALAQSKRYRDLMESNFFYIRRVYKGRKW
jgi:SNF2 family DNA or RNA helicase